LVFFKINDIDRAEEIPLNFEGVCCLKSGAGHLENKIAVRMILFAWFDHSEEFFSFLVQSLDV